MGFVSHLPRLCNEELSHFVARSWSSLYPLHSWQLLNSRLSGEADSLSWLMVTKADPGDCDHGYIKIDDELSQTTCMMLSRLSLTLPQRDSVTFSTMA